MLTNSNITLRAPEPEDLACFYQWENDTSLWSYGSTIAPFSKYTIKEYIAAGGGDLFETKQLRLMIIQNATLLPLGMVDLFDYDPFHRRACLGILIGKEYQEKGVATEALGLFMNYAFDFLGLHQLYAHVPQKNIASIHLFSKLGFIQQGVLRDWIRIGNSFEDVLFFQSINPAL